MNIAEFEALQKKLQDAQTQKAQAEGALAQLFEQAKTEFDCASIEALQAKAAELSASIEKQTERFNAELAELKTIMGANV